MTRYGPYTAAALALAMATPAATAIAGPSDAQITIGWAETVDTLNPATTGARNVGPILANIFDTMIWLTPDFEIAPLLATQWSVSEDGLTYTFDLREDVTFHDGEPFNAAAVVENIRYIKDEDTQSKISPGLLGPCASAEAVGEFQVTFTCTEPFAPFLTQLGSPYLGIQSPKAIATHGADLGQHPTGTGPFKFVSWEPNQSVVVERFDDYNWMSPAVGHEGPAPIKKITFQIVPNPQSRVSQFQSGQSQIMQQTPGAYWKAFTASNQYQTMPVPISGMGIFAPINASKAPTDDLRVRQAIMHAVNIDGVIQLAEAGVYEPSRTPLSKGMVGYAPELADMYPHDLDKATALLMEAGWEKLDGMWQKNGEPLTIELTAIATKAHYGAIAQAIQGYLREFGMDASVAQLATPAWLAANVNGDISMTPLQYVGVDPDLLHFWFLPDQYFNWSHWTDPELTKVINNARTIQDVKARTKAYQDAQRMIMENAVMLPIRENADLMTMSKSIDGVTHSGGGFQYFGAASIKD
ncbi:MAG: ABC transporter substrate-binding protein [Pseudomonadota bacterium]